MTYPDDLIELKSPNELGNIRLIVAITPSNVIGKNGGLPFYISDDLLHFKQLTAGRVVVMGRKTFESIGRPLPGRINVILSRSGAPIDGCQVFTNPSEVVAVFGPNFDVIGGAEIYRVFLQLGLIDEAVISHIDEDVSEGVLTKFPFELIESQFSAGQPGLRCEKNETNDSGFTVVTYLKA